MTKNIFESYSDILFLILTWVLTESKGTHHSTIAIQQIEKYEVVELSS